MKSLSLAVVAIFLLALGVLAVTGPQGEVEKKAVDKRAARIAQAIQGKAFSVSDAVRVAELQTGGRAVSSKVEIEKNGKAVVEVLILKNVDGPVLLEVDVDGETNDILETESADDDDDHDGDDDDDDDGDDDDQ